MVKAKKIGVNVEPQLLQKGTESTITKEFIILRDIFNSNSVTLIEDFEKSMSVII